MRILFTNTSLAHRTGSELYVLEVARALLARGHQPLAWSPVLGDLAAELRTAGIPVSDDLAALAAAGPPDLIHGQHHLETMTALLHFPKVPGIFVCHGALPWEESPPRFPRLRRYVAVDEATRERLTAEGGIPPERISTLWNFVDLARFHPRPPLPRRPGRALAFSNNASEATFLPAVQAACDQAGLALDVAGIASGRPCPRPEELLPAYDLVFAKARAALEALAVGCAVVLCDAAGCGPLVTAADFDRLRPQNFGFRTLTEPVRPAALLAQIERYDPEDAARVRDRIRAEAGLDAAIDRLVEVYAQALAAPAPEEADPEAEGRAVAAYLRWLNPYLKERGDLLIDRNTLWQRVDRQTAELAAAQEEREQLQARLTAAQAEAGGKAKAEEEAAALRAELAALQGTTTWRLYQRFTARPALRRLYRWFFRRAGADS
ncbi:MAG TPA: glycosyltransferase [Thermoanaerobaculia bacterium]|nr:glycosyltransferase [Thermoanaerobaculia bacterium]